MSIQVRVPSVGESISEGRLVRWLKKDGDVVSMDEPLFELETEKATADVPSPAAGTLRIVVPEGQTVAIGSVAANIEESTAAPTTGSPRPGPVEQREASTPAESVTSKRDGDQAAGGSGKQLRQAPPRPELSPAARKLAEENQVDVSRLAGSGRGGRVTKEDVAAYLEGTPTRSASEGDRSHLSSGSETRAEHGATPNRSVSEGIVSPPRASPEVQPPQERFLAPMRSPGPSQSPAVPSGNRETREPMSPIRRRIADRLLASQKSTATLTTFNEADLSAISALRQQYKESFREKHGVGLGFMAFFVKACVEALQAYPIVNGRIDGEEIVYHHYFNIGVAVSTEKGLIVPVIRDADALSLAAIEHEIAELSQKAREGKVTVSDLQGGTFTITNGGVFGSLVSTPIINPPQSAILGMHAIQKRPVAVDDQVVIRPMMYLALSYDHRLIDGREAVLFLVRVKECIESPERLLLEL